jgi:hypothetical protein
MCASAFSNLCEIWKIVQKSTPPNLMKQAAGLQGNFDVKILKAGASTPEQVKAAGVCVCLSVSLPPSLPPSLPLPFSLQNHHVPQNHHQPHPALSLPS